MLTKAKELKRPYPRSVWAPSVPTATSSEVVVTKFVWRVGSAFSRVPMTERGMMECSSAAAIVGSSSSLEMTPSVWPFEMSARNRSAPLSARSQMRRSQCRETVAKRSTPLRRSRPELLPVLTRIMISFVVIRVYYDSKCLLAWEV